MLALLLRTSMALALAAPPPAAPPGRDPTGVEVRQGEGDVAPTQEPTGRDGSAPIVPAPAEAGSLPVDASPAPPPVVASAPEPAPQAEGPLEDESDGPAYDPLVDSPEAIRARHWVRSGIVFMVVGGILSIGAIAMSQAEVNNVDTGATPCNPRSDPAGNGCTPGGRKRATAALAVPGGVLLAGGVAMLTVGKLQQRRLATSLRADRRGFYLGVTLRF